MDEDRVPIGVGDVVASGPMSREVACWYVELTDGQFRAYQHANAAWYLYTTDPAGPACGAASLTPVGPQP